MMHLSVAASGLSRQAMHQFVTSFASRVVSEHGVVLDAAWLGSGPIFAIKGSGHGDYKTSLKHACASMARSGDSRAREIGCQKKGLSNATALGACDQEVRRLSPSPVMMQSWGFECLLYACSQSEPELIGTRGLADTLDTD